MTREEAIKIFHTVLFFGKCDCSKEEIEECLKMAIKALRQEPIIKDDLERHKQNIQAYAHDFGVSEEQAEKELTVKNDLGVDCISRQAINGYIDYILSHGMGKKKSFDFIKKFVANLPPVTPQESQSFKWCTDCKEYDQEKHCCHRWSKVIRDTVEEMKQEYIEREVLDKIRAEIEQLRPNLRPEQMTDYDYAMVDVVNDIVAIIDEYKSESEADNG